jgi:hypothetical protein
MYHHGLELRAAGPVSSRPSLLMASDMTLSSHCTATQWILTRRHLLSRYITPTCEQARSACKSSTHTTAYSYVEPRLSVINIDTLTTWSEMSLCHVDPCNTCTGSTDGRYKNNSSKTDCNKSTGCSRTTMADHTDHTTVACKVMVPDHTTTCRACLSTHTSLKLQYIRHPNHRFMHVAC